jgi:uncharacterized membrane protein YcaP (DUF421 family)
MMIRRLLMLLMAKVMIKAMMIFMVLMSTPIVVIQNGE